VAQKPESLFADRRVERRAMGSVAALGLSPTIGGMSSTDAHCDRRWIQLLVDTIGNAWSIPRRAACT
jgi:hypothetical protein